ncbi:unnamed protein product [Penicillium olsonii]|nr:unnamed protein product [Penicillium olsonii]CAG7933698.1 unnamed protein product [Penicillium olsonii]
MDNQSSDIRAQFPSHYEPRVWLITAGDSPIGLSVARQVLAHGDYAFLGLAHTALERDERRRDEFDAFLAEVAQHHADGWAQRMKTVPLDIRMMGECQAVVADAVATFGKVDILLCCTSQSTVEELAASTQTQNLVRDQFEVNYFGPLNIIKAALPHMRRERAGHVMIISGIITSVPPIFPAYSPANNQAPLFRGILNHLVPQLPDAVAASGSPATPSRAQDESSRVSSIENGPFSAPEVVSMHPPLSSAHLEVLVEETVYAITSIGGHENPPSRHIVGQEGVASVKEKLKTVSEELEDFIQASFAVDVAADSDPMPPMSEMHGGF